MGMEVQIDRMRRDLETINSFNATPERGVTRFTFSQEYLGARAYLIEELKRIGARISICRAGNLRARLEGSDRRAPAVMTGSHLDSVFQGGRFDGAVGVVAALEAARSLVEKGLAHRHPIDVVVFAEEEGSRFGSVLTGSRAWAGKLSLEALGQIKDKEGLSYLDAMRQSGIIPEDDSILNPSEIRVMFEVHIEQSLVLESRRLRIGVVEAIAGIKQFLVILQGIPNHAGATPMSLRVDALQGAARIISAVEEIAAYQAGKDTVATVGFLNCQPGQANIIPGRVEFTLDIRDRDSGLLDKTVQKVMEVIAKTCEERRLTYEVKTRSNTPPVALSKEIVRLIEKLAQERNAKSLRMVSGAVHDSSVMTELTEVGMIFLPSQGGRSHCPEEFTDLKDIQLGTEILLGAITELSA
jgi:allantoate deiminase